MKTIKKKLLEEAHLASLEALNMQLQKVTDRIIHVSRTLSKSKKQQVWEELLTPVVTILNLRRSLTGKGPVFRRQK